MYGMLCFSPEALSVYLTVAQGAGIVIEATVSSTSW